MEQLKLSFDEVPISCSEQEKYHAIAPILAGKVTIKEQAQNLNQSYTTLRQWLEKFRKEGVAGLVEQKSSRQPYTPERIIVSLLYFKCCVPKIADRELARVISQSSNYQIDHKTVKSLLERYFFWKYEEFSSQIKYPIPKEIQLCRLEMVKLMEQGFSEKTIAYLLGYTRHTVHKWIRRYKAQSREKNIQPWLFDRSSKPKTINRKVYFGTIRAVLELQKKYGYAGWFRIQGYLERDYGIKLAETTIKKIMKLNRQLHLAPTRPVRMLVKESKEGPLKSGRAFEHTFVDFRYLDAKPEGVQLYSCLLLEGYSRTILAGSLTTSQDAGVLLRVYYLALSEFGCWEVVVSDNGGQFISKAFEKVNKRLNIYHHKNDKGHPWQNLIESQFGIQARVGEYAWSKCKTIEQAIELHHSLIHDHNTLAHFAHRHRNDGKLSPLAVLSSACGRAVTRSDLHLAFSRKCWERKTDRHGFARINKWKIYIEEGLPKTPVQVSYWDGKLRAEYDSTLLVEYSCKWDKSKLRPKSISRPILYETAFNSPQIPLFDSVLDINPRLLNTSTHHPKPPIAVGQQLNLYFGPELVK
jgi:transposase